MIAMLRGCLVQKDFEGAVLDVGGVGYRVRMPMTTLEQLPSVGEEVQVFTTLNVREDAMELFGFCTQGDKRVFEKLVTVSGIGPKVAINVLSTMNAREVVMTIVGGDVRALCKVKGVGKKTAERLVLELKDSISKIDLGDGGNFAEASVGGSFQLAPAPLEDLRSALNNLGYPPPTVEKALERVAQEAGDADFDGMLRAALKFLRSRK